MHTRLLRALAPLVAAQFGVVSRAQLRAVGASDTTIARWIADRLLFRVHPAVYAVGHRALTRDGRWMAAQLWAGEAGMLGYWTGAMLHALRAPADMRAHVIVPPTASARHPTLGVHRTPVLPHQVEEIGAFRVTTWARTIVDCADIASDRQVRALVDKALELRIYDHAQMQEAVAGSRGRRGSRRLRRVMAVLEDEPAIFRSWTERRVRDALVALGLPAPEVNVVMLREDGSPVELDLFWRDSRVNVEVDGPHHEMPFQRRADRARDAWLRGRDVLVLRYPVRGLQPAVIAADVRPVLAGRGRRPAA